MKKNVFMARHSTRDARTMLSNTTCCMVRLSTTKLVPLDEHLAELKTYRRGVEPSCGVDCHGVDRVRFNQFRRSRLKSTVRAQGCPDGINGHVSEASLQVRGHRPWFDRERDELCQIYLPKTRYT